MFSTDFLVCFTILAENIFFSKILSRSSHIYCGLILLLFFFRVIGLLSVKRECVRVLEIVQETYIHCL